MKSATERIFPRLAKANSAHSVTRRRSKGGKKNRRLIELEVVENVRADTPSCDRFSRADGSEHAARVALSVSLRGAPFSETRCHRYTINPPRGFVRETNRPGETVGEEFCARDQGNRRKGAEGWRAAGCQERARMGFIREAFGSGAVAQVHRGAPIPLAPARMR